MSQSHPRTVAKKRAMMCSRHCQPWVQLQLQCGKSLCIRQALNGQSCLGTAGMIDIF